MQSRIVILLIALMALAMVATANPLPANDAVLVKKALKQYDIKRAAQRRDDDGKPKPSKHWRALDAEPTGDGKPKPSKHWRAAEARATA